MKAGALVAVILTAVLAAQTPGTHPVSGRRFAPVMGYQGAAWLERAERIEEEAPDVALKVLQIPQAPRADIGAASGYSRPGSKLGAAGAVLRE